MPARPPVCEIHRVPSPHQAAGSRRPPAPPRNRVDRSGRDRADRDRARRLLDGPLTADLLSGGRRLDRPIRIAAPAWSVDDIEDEEDVLPESEPGPAPAPLGAIAPAPVGPVAISPAPQAPPRPETPTPSAVSPGRIRELLAMTPDGRAVLARSSPTAPTRPAISAETRRLIAMTEEGRRHLARLDAGPATP